MSRSSHIIKSLPGANAGQKESARDAPDRASSYNKGELKGRVIRGKQAQAAPPAPLSEELAPDFPLSGESEDQASSSPERKREPESREELTQRLRSEWEEELEQRLEEARAEARAEGQEAARVEAEAEIEDMQAVFDEEREALAQGMAQLKERWQEYIEESQPLLAEMAFEIAETVLNAPLPRSVRCASEEAIAEAVEELAGEGMLTVRLHPVDCLRLQEAGVTGRLEALHAQLRLETDPELEEGAWTAESPTATIRHFKGELMGNLRDRLGMKAEPSAHWPSRRAPEKEQPSTEEGEATEEKA